MATRLFPNYFEISCCYFCEGWQSPPRPPDDDEPVQSVEFSDEEEVLPDSPLERSSDMLASGSSSQPAAATYETAIDDDYDELMAVVPPPPSRPSPHHDLDLPPPQQRAHSPFIPSRDSFFNTEPSGSRCLLRPSQYTFRIQIVIRFIRIQSGLGSPIRTHLTSNGT